MRGKQSDIYCDDIVISLLERDYINQKGIATYNGRKSKSSIIHYRYVRAKVIWIMIKQIINNAEFYLNNKNIITLLSIFYSVDRSWKLNL